MLVDLVGDDVGKPDCIRTTGISTAILAGQESDAMSSPIRTVKNNARS
jgi:hypothetical protein